MAESFVTLSAGFSTADADRPDISYADGELLVKFKDWREQPVALRFPDTVAFRWQDEAALPASVRDDTPYEVIDSTWIVEFGRSMHCHRNRIITCFASMQQVS